MDISIIIPCHNLEKYISKCLISILTQNFDRNAYEIIIVFDHCNDGTEQKVCEVLGTFPNKKLLHTEFCRPGLARNAGLDVAEGKYVWFIDGDDYLINDKAFSILTESIKNGNCVAVYMNEFDCDIPFCDDHACWRFFYERKFLGEYRFTDAPVNEDWEFTKRLKNNIGYSEKAIDGKFYHYTYPRDGSIITERNRYKRQLYNQKKSEIKNKIKEKNNENDNRKKENG